MKSTVFTPALAEGLTEYHFLVSRGYPAKGALNLVGDRRGLSKTQRTVIYRGVFPPSESAYRFSKIAPARVYENIENQPMVKVLKVDLLNVVFTVANYLFGRTLFIATDGFLRDDGENYERVYHFDVHKQAVELVIFYLQASAFHTICLAIDGLHDFSQQITTAAEQLIANKNASEGAGSSSSPSISSSISSSSSMFSFSHDNNKHQYIGLEVCKNPDLFLLQSGAGKIEQPWQRQTFEKQQLNGPDCTGFSPVGPANEFDTLLATSDSEIIEQSPWRVSDLARHVIENHFSPVFPELSRILRFDY